VIGQLESYTALNETIGSINKQPYCQSMFCTVSLVSAAFSPKMLSNEIKERNRKTSTSTEISVITFMITETATATTNETLALSGSQYQQNS